MAEKHGETGLYTLAAAPAEFGRAVSAEYEPEYERPGKLDNRQKLNAD